MNIDFSKLTGDNGPYRTKSLFREYSKEGEYAPFTLKENDHDGYISMYRVYMECDNEYEAAMKCLNSWKHWKALTSSVFFKKEIDSWRDERDIRNAAIAARTMVDAATDGNVTAAKYLMDRVGSHRNKSKKTLTENIENRKKQVELNSKVSSIIDRMQKN